MYQTTITYSFMQEDGSTVPEELTYPTAVQPTEEQSVAAAVAAYEEGPKKRTSIGQSPRSRPKNKNARRQFKRNVGQGKRR